MPEIKLFRLTCFVFMLFFTTSIQVFGQELDQIKEDEESDEWDAILNTI